jgi:hypothetical protein
MPRTLVAGLLVAALAASGCDDNANISGLPGYIVSEVQVSPRVDTLFVPDTIRTIDTAKLSRR